MTDFQRFFFYGSRDSKQITWISKCLKNFFYPFFYLIPNLIISFYIFLVTSICFSKEMLPFLWGKKKYKNLKKKKFPQNIKKKSPKFPCQHHLFYSRNESSLYYLQKNREHQRRRTAKLIHECFLKHFCKDFLKLCTAKILLLHFSAVLPKSCHFDIRFCFLKSQT